MQFLLPGQEVMPGVWPATQKLAPPVVRTVRLIPVHRPLSKTRGRDIIAVT